MVTAGKGIIHTGVSFVAKLTITGEFSHLTYALMIKDTQKYKDNVILMAHHNLKSFWK
jgi:hypothetical protein